MSREYCPSCGSSTALGEIHCFKCGYLQPQYKITPGYFNNEVRKQINSIFNLEDIEYNPKNFPPQALQWLYSAGIYDAVILEQFIGYCSHLNRVIIPAYDNENNIRFIQTRSLDLNKDPVKYKTYGKMSEYIVHYSDHNSKTVIIVEDHLSAIRIRKLFNAIALSGTNINNEIIKSIVYQYSKIILWLDPDKPGQQAAYKLNKKFHYCAEKLFMKNLFMSNKCNYLCTKIVDNTIATKDPKLYLDCEINDIIESHTIQLP